VFQKSSPEYPKPSYSVYRRKYHLLLERMAAMNQDSEIIVYRISKIKQLLREGMKERSFLMNELDKRGDNYRGVPILQNPYMSLEGKKKEPGTTEKKGKKNKGEKEKAVRDPNLPKRPQNPFFQFCKEQREQVSKEVLDSTGTQLSKKELTKMLAQKWNVLDPELKQVYNLKFEEEKAGYTVKMEKYRRMKSEYSEGATSNLEDLDQSGSNLEDIESGNLYLSNL